MKASQVILTCALAVIGAPKLSAQPFNSGSNGSYGVMNIAENTTLDLPPDGVFHCTTITVATGRTLRFNRNALNTPVYLLATGDVAINGTIEVSGSRYDDAAPGAGGPGGFDGGYAGFGTGPSSIGGDGHGPGGGKNSNAPGIRGGAFAQAARSNTNIYGNALLSPLIGGSGGAGSDGSPGYIGGGGGGAALIASNTRITLGGGGHIAANGGAGFFAGGSGGGIRLVAPVVSGTGSLSANRGANLSEGSSGAGPGSVGRIRIDTTDRYAYRNLRVQAGVFSHGSQMFVFPPVLPRLDIVEAAGQAIPAGTANAVNIQLAAGSPTNQMVRVQARDFAGVVPIDIVVVPENGASTAYPAQIDMRTGNPTQVSVEVAIPSGTFSRIYAWTR